MPDRRDSKSSDNARVTALANDTHAQDDVVEYRYEALGNTYNTNQIYYYDLIILGHESTAQILAREISLVLTKVKKKLELTSNVTLSLLFLLSFTKARRSRLNGLDSQHHEFK